MSGEALLATPARPLYEPSHRRPKKEPIFGFRAYSRSEPLGLMLAPRHQVTRFGELLPISEMGQKRPSDYDGAGSVHLLIADLQRKHRHDRLVPTTEDHLTDPTPLGKGTIQT